MDQLTTTAAVLDALGGTPKVAAKLGVPYKVVHGWRGRNRFPARYTDEIRALLGDIAVPAELFGQVRRNVAHEHRGSV
jgi:hypothetical protein